MGLGSYFLNKATESRQDCRGGLVQGARFSGGRDGDGPSFCLKQKVGRQDAVFPRRPSASLYGTGDADDAEATRSQTTAYDSMPRAKHAKVAMCMF